MAEFNWHSDEITRQTVVSSTYKSTQNVRRFLKSQCGEQFKFDRDFMGWIKNGEAKTMGDVANEWLLRNG